MDSESEGELDKTHLEEVKTVPKTLKERILEQWEGIASKDKPRLQTANQSTKQESHFFLAAPKDPYTYVKIMDGVDPGLYHPSKQYVHPDVKQVTREKFLDMRVHKQPVIVPETKYPDCTYNGSSLCNL